MTEEEETELQQIRKNFTKKVNNTIRQNAKNDKNYKIKKIFKYTENQRAHSAMVASKSGKEYRSARVAAIVDDIIDQKKYLSHVDAESGLKFSLTHESGSMFGISLDRKNNDLPHDVEDEPWDCNQRITCLALNTSSNILNLFIPNGGVKKNILSWLMMPTSKITDFDKILAQNPQQEILTLGVEQPGNTGVRCICARAREDKKEEGSILYRITLPTHVRDYIAASGQQGPKDLSHTFNPTSSTLTSKSMGAFADQDMALRATKMRLDAIIAEIPEPFQQIEDAVAQNSKIVPSMKRINGKWVHNKLYLTALNIWNFSSDQDCAKKKIGVHDPRNSWGTSFRKFYAYCLRVYQEQRGLSAVSQGPLMIWADKGPLLAPFAVSCDAYPDVTLGHREGNIRFVAQFENITDPTNSMTKENQQKTADLPSAFTPEIFDDMFMITPAERSAVTALRNI